MSAIYVLLFLEAFFLFAFATIFVAGSLIHLASIGKETLQATSRTREAKAEASPAKPAPQLGHAPKAVPARIGVEVGAAYARA